MAGYTRQSTASIINGSNITAPPLNTEFNQLQAAFNASSGHTHTGGTGDAPKINLTTSVSGYLPAAHGGIGGKNTLDATTTPVATNDNSEGYAPGSMWENTNTGRIYICVGSSSNAAVWRELLQVQNGNSILPAATNTVDIGSNTVRFQDLFLSGGIAAAGNTTVGGTLNITGATALGSTLGVTGDTTLANLSATGTTVITSVDLNSGAIDNTTIGSATPAAGTFTTLNANTSLVAATADINGGSLDGATVGASVPSTGSFTTLGASGTSTLTTVDINGGNIDGTVIGASTKAAGSFTTLSTTGQATLASADINGGSIDGSTIGANSASTGAFTTLTASGGITGSLTGNVSGNVTGNVTGAVTGNVTGNLTGNVTSSGASSFNNVTIDGTLNMNAGTTATITNLTTPQNSGDAASKGYVDSEISALIGDAGAGLDTLGELADALNDDDAFSTTVTNSIATKLPKAGGTMTGAIAMSTNKITGAGDPTSAQDVATKAYTDTQRDTRVAKTGDTMSGALAMGNNKITGLATPTAGTDVTNKTYVDGILGSATVAATSATNAATSETNAATSATNAATSETNAATSATNAASSYDQFDDRYLGSKSSAPTVDNDGDALITGALYFNSTSNIMYVYGGSGWQAAGSSVNGTSERNTYTATAGQTVFAAAYDTGYIDVYLNGVKLLAGTDFTATNGTSITLASGASVNDVVDIVAYGTFALADHYTRTASDARYVEVAGDTMTGNLSFGDNDKAIFGASSDLQIYHDGANSIIADAGTGNLNIQSNSTQINLQKADGTKMLEAINNGNVVLYSNGAERLRANGAGINVTGQVDVNSSARIDSSGIVKSANGTEAAPAHSFLNDPDNGMFRPTTNTVGFSTAGTERLRIDSLGRVGIGTSSLSAELTIGADTPQIDLLKTSSADVLANIRAETDAGSGGKLVFQTKRNGNTALDRMTIDDDGNVGIGASPSAPLHVFKNQASPTIVARFENPADEAIVEIKSKNTDLGVLQFADTEDANVGAVQYSHSENSMRFKTNDAERMRIDSSGNVLVGKTAPTIATTGVELRPNGQVFATQSGNYPLLLNRTTSEGTIAEFRKDNAPVGSIGSYAGGTGNLDVSSAGTTTKLRLQNMVEFVDSRWSANEQVAPTKSGVDLGNTGTNTWDNLYLSGGVYLGGTGSANKLDDYEIGAASSLAISGSYGNCPSSGWTLVDSDYVKVGKSVTVRARFINTSTNNVQVDDRAVVSGLPFTSDSFGTVASAGTCFIYGQISGGINAMGVTALSTNGTDAFFYITHEDGAVQYNVPLTVIFSYKTT